MRKIMVVDDEPEMIDALKMMLASEGYEVSGAQSGGECLMKVGSIKPDLILLDIRMPGMDGWETLRRLKSEGVTKKTKVIILTVEKGPGTEIFGLQDEVADFITKPFDMKDLLDTVKKTIK